MANGGKREGAGRPPVPADERRLPMTIYLPEASQIELYGQAVLRGMSPGEWIEVLLAQDSAARRAD